MYGLVVLVVFFLLLLSWSILCCPEKAPALWWPQLKIGCRIVTAILYYYVVHKDLPLPGITLYVSSYNLIYTKKKCLYCGFVRLLGSRIMLPIDQKCSRCDSWFYLRNTLHVPVWTGRCLCYVPCCLRKMTLLSANLSSEEALELGLSYYMWSI